MILGSTQGYTIRSTPRADTAVGSVSPNVSLPTAVHVSSFVVQQQHFDGAPCCARAAQRRPRGFQKKYCLVLLYTQRRLCGATTAACSAGGGKNPPALLANCCAVYVQQYNSAGNPRPCSPQVYHMHRGRAVHGCCGVVLLREGSTLRDCFCCRLL